MTQVQELIARLEEIEARANKATEGPWEVEPYDHSDKWTTIIPPVARVDYDDVDHDEQDANTFIAHARTDIPYLLAALRTSQEWERRLREALNDLLALCENSSFENGVTDQSGRDEGDTIAGSMIDKARAALQPEKESGN